PISTTAALGQSARTESLAPGKVRDCGYAMPVVNSKGEKGCIVVSIPQGSLQTNLSSLIAQHRLAESPGVSRVQVGPQIGHASCLEAGQLLRSDGRGAVGKAGA